MTALTLLVAGSGCGTTPPLPAATPPSTCGSNAECVTAYVEDADSKCGVASTRLMSKAQGADSSGDGWKLGLAITGIVIGVAGGVVEGLANAGKPPDNGWQNAGIGIGIVGTGVAGFGPPIAGYFSSSSGRWSGRQDSLNKELADFKKRCLPMATGDLTWCESTARRLTAECPVYDQ